MGIPFHGYAEEKARAYLHSLTDDQAALEEMLVSMQTPGARKVFALKGGVSGKSTFIRLLKTLLVDVNFYNVSDEHWSIGANTVVCTQHIIHRLPWNPFAVLIMDIGEAPYDGPLDVTVITFRTIKEADANMLEKLLLLKDELMTIIKFLK